MVSLRVHSSLQASAELTDHIDDILGSLANVLNNEELRGTVAKYCGQLSCYIAYKSIVPAIYLSESQIASLALLNCSFEVDVNPWEIDA